MQRQTAKRYHSLHDAHLSKYYTHRPTVYKLKLYTHQIKLSTVVWTGPEVKLYTVYSTVHIIER